MTTTPLLVLAACGDDDSISKEDFIEQADAMCAASDAELEGVFDSVWEFDEDFDFDDPANQNVVHVRFNDAMQQLKPVALQQLDGDDDPFAEIDRRATEYGFTVCGENG